MQNTTITYKKPRKTNDKKYHKLFFWRYKITKMLREGFPKKPRKVTLNKKSKKSTFLSTQKSTLLKKVLFWVLKKGLCSKKYSKKDFYEHNGSKKCFFEYSKKYFCSKKYFFEYLKNYFAQKSTQKKASKKYFYSKKVLFSSKKYLH